jgi:hypothetical protein
MIVDGFVINFANVKSPIKSVFTLAKITAKTATIMPLVLLALATMGDVTPIEPILLLLHHSMKPRQVGVGDSVSRYW